jgi:hypothetical protein
MTQEEMSAFSELMQRWVLLGAAIAVGGPAISKALGAAIKRWFP